jgi:solute carrier family 50 protein (sugar transporter)
MKLSSFLIFLLAAAAGQSEAFHPTSTTAITKSSSVRDGKRHQAKHVKLSEPTPMSFRGGSSLEMSSASSIVTTLVPRIGILTSTLLYFSPFTAVRQASSIDSLNDLNPVPLAIMAVSSLCWLVYGLSVRDPYVTLSNVPGCIASIWYVVAVLPFLKGGQLQTTQNIVVGLSALTINLWTWLSLTSKSLEQVSSSLGLFASALFIVLSGSPLSTIKTVLATKDSKSILTQLTFAQITNTALWSAYGLAIKDKFVYGPNLTGLGFGLIQLALKLVFPSK